MKAVYFFFCAAGHRALFLAWKRTTRHQREVLSILLKQEPGLCHKPPCLQFDNKKSRVRTATTSTSNKNRDLIAMGCCLMNLMNNVVFRIQFDTTIKYIEICYFIERLLLSFRGLQASFVSFSESRCSPSPAVQGRGQ